MEVVWTTVTQEGPFATYLYAQFTQSRATDIWESHFQAYVIDQSSVNNKK